MGAQENQVEPRIVSPHQGPGYEPADSDHCPFSSTARSQWGKVLCCRKGDALQLILWLPLELFLQGATEVCYPSGIPSASRKEWSL